jgi:hypothetical protein
MLDAISSVGDAFWRIIKDLFVVRPKFDWAAETSRCLGSSLGCLIGPVFLRPKIAEL